MVARTGYERLQEVLQAGEFEGIRFTVLSPKPIEVGDTYLAARNTGPHLLTAQVVDRENNWVVSKEPGYLYDIPECIVIQLHPWE